MPLKDFGGDARYAAKQALLGPNAGSDMSFASIWDALKVPYQLYDNPGLYQDDTGIVSPYAFGGGQIPVFDGQQFKLMQGDQTLYSGSGYDALKQATDLSKSLGSGWKIISSLPDADPDSTAVNPLFEKGGAGLGYAGKQASDVTPTFFLGALPMAAALAAPAVGSLLGGAGGGAAGAAGAAGTAAGAGSAAAGLGAAVLPAFEGITVLGSTAGGLGALGAAGLGAAGLGAGAAALGGGSGAGAGAAVDPITVVGNPTAGIDLGALGSLGIDFGGLSGMEALGGGTPAPAPTEQEIVVEGASNPPPLDLLGGVSPIDLAALGAAATVPLTASQPVTAATSTTDKIIKGLRAAGLLSGSLGNAVAGGSDSGTIPSGAVQSLNPIFTASLPSATMSLGSARSMPAQDWTRYAMRPEQSFFGNVPQGYTPPAAGTLDPAWDKEHNFAVGGNVRGAGTGRSDSIPANLSDGEYVMDAETVSLLGDGSNRAGAKALDTFRANVRRDKGRKLAKGEFSVGAKKPERYLRGRK